MSEPFEVVPVDVSALTCEGCAGGLLGTPESELVGSVDVWGHEHFWHEVCAPQVLRAVLLMARSREKAQWN